MRSKERVETLLDSTTNKVELIIRGLESRTISVDETLEYLKQAKRLLENATELVEIEPEG